MSERNFRKMLEAKWMDGKFVCVGLDSDYSKIPESLHKERSHKKTSVANTIFGFNTGIVKATYDLVCAYKLNSAFYEAHGNEGIEELQATIRFIHQIAPDVPVILDAKRADIGNTNDGYVTAAFDFFQADAITVNPYLGAEALKPFLDRKDKGIFVLCRTSNPGAGEFQDLPVSTIQGIPIPLYKVVANQVAKSWNKNFNCGLVVGATYPRELSEIRRIAFDTPLLIPGIGAQGGDVEKTISAAKDSRGKGFIINSSRGIIFDPNPRQAAIGLDNLIKQYL